MSDDPHPHDDPVPEPTPDDAALLAALRTATARLDPAPAELVSAGRATFAWRTIDAELAELSFDSLVDGLVGVRSSTTAAGPRQLSFEAGTAAVEVELAGDRLVGQLLPPGPARVELHQGTDVVATRADDLGRFSFDVRVSTPPAGGTPPPWRLRVDGDAFRLVTAWFTP
jgi:hypothetical protein